MSGLEDWIPLGPYGGDVADVAASPTNGLIVLAGVAPSSGSGGALYRSTDGAATWSPIAQLAGRSVFDIAFDAGGIAYIGTQDGVWKSVDGGAVWTPLNLNIGLNDTVLDVTVDPGNSNVVYAAVDDALGNQPANVMRSPDGGQTWFDISGPLPTLACRAIAVDPGNSLNVYAALGGAFGGGQFWYSANGGASWENRSAGLPNRPLNDVLHDGARLLLGGGQAFGSQTVGLYSSPDHGQTWTPLHDGTWPSLIVNDIEVFPAGPSTILLATNQGVFRSTTGGANWSFGIGGTAGLSLNAVRFRSGGDVPVIHAGAAAVGVWRSVDNGASFAQASVGIGALNVVSVAANPRNADELAIAFQGLNNGGVYASTDGGQNWALQNLPGTRYSAVRFAPDGRLYAVSSGPTSIAPEGLYRREANGVWTASLGPDQGALFESDLLGVTFSEFDPFLIFTFGSDFGVAGAEPTIWRSTTGGASWTKVYEGATPSEDVTDVRIVADGTDATLLASFTDFGQNPQTGGALRSTTAGADWIPSSTGLAAEAQGTSLSPSPADRDTFFLSDGDVGVGLGGLFRTMNAGASWTSTGYVGTVSQVVADSNDANVVYILRPGEERVLRSTNGGATFSPFNMGLAAGGSPRSLAFAAAACPRLLFSGGNGTFGRDLGYSAPGDANCDCAYNFFDIDPFVLALFDPAVYASTYPDCPIATCDLDGNGRVNFFDIDPFVDLLVP